MGLVLSSLVVAIVSALGLDDPLTGGGRESISLSDSFGMLILTVSVAGGAVLGCRKGDSGPDPATVQQSTDYFQFLQGDQEAKTGGSASKKGDPGDGESGT